MGIDTSSDICGIALTEDKTLIAEFKSNIKRAHAEKIIFALDQVLSAVNLRPQQLDGIAVAIGPGSFTGLRIGLAAVKGLALATGLPVVAVPSMDALALQAYFWPDQICTLMKAQANEGYAALYHIAQGQLVRDTTYQLITLDLLGQLIKQKTLLINCGMKNLTDFIEGELTNMVEIAPPEFSMTSGYFVALLGVDKFIQQQLEDIDKLEPLYLKDFKARVACGL